MSELGSEGLFLAGLRYINARRAASPEGVGRRTSCAPIRSPSDVITAQDRWAGGVVAHPIG